MEIENSGNGLVDLAIIGGGPAGTAAALEARRHGLDVALWERDRFPRHKVCGEFISAESLPFLQNEIPQALERGARILRSEFISPSGRTAAFDLPHEGCGLSRHLLDMSLWSAAGAAGAHLNEANGVVSLRKPDQARNRDGAWEIQSASGARTRARALVIACGRWWSIEGFPSPAREPRRGAAGPWLGVKAHFTGVPPHDAVEMYYFPGGYCGLAPIEGGLYNVCCLVHRNLAGSSGGARMEDFAAWLKSVARHPALDSRLRGASQNSETISTAPVRAARRHAASQDALLVGDAAGFLDPFTGDGISMALQSGRLAGREIGRALSQNEMVSTQAASLYPKQFGSAVRRSYLVAGALRALVSAPAGVQTSAAAALPWLGARLLAMTRWRHGEKT